MEDHDKTRELMGVLVETARAHHAATGGPNPQWAQWYAERAADQLNRVLDTDRSVEDWAEWLTGADMRYRDQDPEQSWPRAYATWLLKEQD